MDCSLAESHYAKNEGLFSGGSGGGHPIGEDHEDQDLYVDQDQGQDEMIKRKRTRMSIYYIVPHQVATPARLLTSWTKKTARAR